MAKNTKNTTPTDKNNSDDLTPCVEHVGHIDAKGYGRYGKFKAHRVEYEKANGPIPRGLHCLHKCDNRKCVNPDHLFLGTNKDNVNDRVSKGRCAPKHGELNGRSVLTEEMVLEIKRELKNYKRGLCKKLAIRYGVQEARISHIKTGRSWKHL